MISESFHYTSPFPSAPFHIFAFRFIISWSPTYKSWRSAFSLNTPRYLTSLKLCQIPHSFSLRFQLQVSPVAQSSATHPELRLDTAAHTAAQRCPQAPFSHNIRFLQLFIFCIFPHWLRKLEVCSDGGRTDKYFIVPHCEKSCNCFSTQPKLQLFC